MRDGAAPFFMIGLMMFGLGFTHWRASIDDWLCVCSGCFWVGRAVERLLEGA